MKFEIGKYYRHPTGAMLYIISAAKTTMWGWTTIAEASKTELIAVGDDESAAVNYTEINENEWMSAFS